MLAFANASRYAVEVIYFISADKSDYPVKIGFTAVDPWSRLSDLQIGNPSKLIVLATMPGDKKFERTLHARFYGDHQMGEWFTRTDDLWSLMKSDSTEWYPPDSRTKVQHPVEDAARAKELRRLQRKRHNDKVKADPKLLAKAREKRNEYRNRPDVRERHNDRSREKQREIRASRANDRDAYAAWITRSREYQAAWRTANRDRIAAYRDSPRA